MKVTEEITKYIDEYEAVSQDPDGGEARRLYILRELTKHHRTECNLYPTLAGLLGTENNEEISKIYDIPMIPASLFKEGKIKSVPDNEVYRVLMSSGTTGKPSLIFLDKVNALNQSRALAKVFTDYLALVRPNILIVDSPGILRKEQEYTARKAGIVGFGSLCRKRFFALREDMTVDLEGIRQVLESNDEKFLVYGFTYILWKHLVQEGIPVSLREAMRERAVLLHGGGWKKLALENISPGEFTQTVKDQLGIANVHEYYGMVEQTGSVFMSCREGFLHSNPFATVIARKPIDLLAEADDGEEGIAQVVSCLPTSYPGHSLITDDLIVVNPATMCRCGRVGKTFRVNGRISTAETRGCSDTYEGLS